MKVELADGDGPQEDDLDAGGDVAERVLEAEADGDRERAERGEDALGVDAERAERRDDAEQPDRPRDGPAREPLDRGVGARHAPHEGADEAPGEAAEHERDGEDERGGQEARHDHARRDLAQHLGEGVHFAAPSFQPG